MPQTLICRIKRYLQPFERTLALLELEALAGAAPEPMEGTDHSYTVESRLPAAAIATQTAYWQEVGDGDDLLTDQVRLEAAGNGKSSRLPNRRVLRYGPHGLHEYRGKFFPQLVRSLINIASVPKSGIVADPMVGSGTTMVEALLSGRQSIGVDMNPLSVLMSDVKCDVLSFDPDALVRAARGLANRATESRNLASSHLDSLSEHDQTYLRRWIPEVTLQDLDRISDAIRRVRDPGMKKLFRLLLSDLLREISWQKDDDLRVRKDQSSARMDAVGAYLEKVRKAVEKLRPFLKLIAARPGTVPPHDVIQGDARSLTGIWAGAREIDCVITSPPYATALPYLDTDRLSLIYLGCLPREAHRSHDLQMIGNREINKRHRTEYLDLLDTEGALLPDSVKVLVKRILSLQAASNPGFRRRNVPSLLTKYFVDMQSVLAETLQCLKPGSSCFMVVGSNHTIAGGERVDIDTPQLLSEISENQGFSLVRQIPMELLVSRDIFRRNRGASESILWLRRPA